MINLSNPNVDSQLKERILFQDENLAYSAYLPISEPQFYGDILWHWHDEFEFGYVIEGTLLYKSNQHEYILQKGDGIFINSGVLHYLQLLVPSQKARIHSQFFNKTFLSGQNGSIFDSKYIQPVMSQKTADLIPFYHQKSTDQYILNNLQNAVHMLENKKPFFEFRLRNLFSSIWETVYTRAMEQDSLELSFNLQEDERIKQLLSFITEHYPEKLTVAQIAGCIPVSERECFRLFQKTLGMSPAEFLLSFRLKKARELLLTTKKTILEIALECGFSNSSYFGKKFKQQYTLSPGDYRKI